jgi:hypothetical protein
MESVGTHAGTSGQAGRSAGTATRERLALQKGANDGFTPSPPLLPLPLAQSFSVACRLSLRAVRPPSPPPQQAKRPCVCQWRQPSIMTATVQTSCGAWPILPTGQASRGMETESSLRNDRFVVPVCTPYVGGICSLCSWRRKQMIN